LDDVEEHLAKAHQRLGAATELFKHQYYEDSVNRAYYAMASAATAALRMKDITAKTHKGLHIKFSKEYVEPGLLDPDNRRMFRYAEDMRYKADYQSSVTITEEEAEAILEDARAFLERVEELIGKMRQ